mgnify:CR=1 FL=1
MARTFRDRMNSLPPERCARIEAETARMVARIEAQDAERAIIRETAQMVHDKPPEAQKGPAGNGGAFVVTGTSRQP